MNMLKIMTVVALGFGVAGCADVDTVSRNTPISSPEFDTQRFAIARDYAVQAVTFAAPSDLRVSESNSYYPNADIVWRGDPIGDRVSQIGAIFATAGERNKSVLNGEVPVIVDFQLVRFHGVTERTRFSVGGVYNIEFMMSVRNAVTGELIEAPRCVNTNLSAPGGIAALMLEQKGQTEKVRVTDLLTQVIRDELSGSYTI